MMRGSAALVEGARPRKLRSIGSSLRLSSPAGTVDEPIVLTTALHRILESGARVVVVVAPPGYGKSGLLSALAATWRGRGDAVSLASFRPGASLNDLGTTRLGHLLVDDIDSVGSDDIGRLIDVYLANSTDHRKLVLTARRLPESDWFRLQLRDDVLFLRQADLTLDEKNTGDLLTKIIGRQATPEIIQRTVAVTEGWCIAVKAIAMAYREKNDRLSHMDFGVSPELNGYFERELFRPLPEDQRTVLLQLAEFDRFNPALIEAVAGVEAAATVQHLIDGAQMIARVPRREGWFRLHGLFRHYLQERRRAARMASDPVQFRRAATWAYGHDAISDAIGFLLKAALHREAQTVLLENIVQLVQHTGEAPRVLEWTTQMAMAGFDIAVPLRLWRIWALIFTLRLETAAQEMADLSPLMVETAPRTWLAHFEKLEVCLVGRKDNPHEVIARANDWLTRWRQSEPFHSASVEILLGLAHQQCYEEAAQRRAFVSARQSALNAESDYARVSVATHEALVDLQSGRIREALQLVEMEIIGASSNCDQSGSVLASASLIAARIHVELGDFAEGRRYLSLNSSAAVDHGMIEVHLAALEAAALLSEESDGCDAALTVLRRGHVRGVRYDTAAKLFMVALLLRHRRTDEACAVFDAVIEHDGGHYHHAPSGIRLSREASAEAERANGWIAFATGDFETAREIVSRLLPLTEMHGRTSAQISLLVLDAAIQRANGYENAAVRQMGRALRIATHRGLKTTLLNDCWAVTALLTQDFIGLNADARDLLALARTKSGLSVNEQDANVSTDRLTPRELEILRLLDSGMTGQTLADHLELGLSTTKWHIHNIYNKLGVRNRSGALAKARRMALL